MSDPNLEKAKKKKKIATIAKFAVLILIVVVFPIYMYFAHGDMIRQFSSFSEALNYLRSYGLRQASIIYIIAQILQIVISILPGQVFQIAAGFVFGFPLGLLLSVIGAFLGSAVTYWLANRLGKDAIGMIFGDEKVEKWRAKLNSDNAYVFSFVFFLIPGTPKDMMNYVAGISDMKFLPYLLITTGARIPAMCISLLFGKFYLQQNYTFMLITAILIGVLLLLIFLFRKKLRELIHDIIERFS